MDSVTKERDEMTSREEIERLLNQTGRTLEGLPRKHSEEERTNALSTFVPWGEAICHQSDVIELLVSALRDALEDRTEEISDAKFEEFSKKAREMAMRRHT